MLHPSAELLVPDFPPGRQRVRVHRLHESPTGSAPSSLQFLSPPASPASSRGNQARCPCNLWQSGTRAAVLYRPSAEDSGAAQPNNVRDRRKTSSRLPTGGDQCVREAHFSCPLFVRTTFQLGRTAGRLLDHCSASKND